MAKLPTTRARQSFPKISTVYQSTTTESEKFIDKKRCNTKSDLIEITHDKLENILLKHLKWVSIKVSWINPLSIFVTILLTILTTDFKEFIGISKDVWNALFLLGLIISLVWLGYSLYLIFANWDKADIDYVINKIKNLDNNGEIQ